MLSVPERVVEYTGDSAFVYVLTSEQPKQQFNKMPITTGITDGINVEIKNNGIDIDSRLRGYQQN